MTSFFGLRAKFYSYLIDDGNEDKKANLKKNNSVIKRKIKFDNYKNSLEATKLDNKIKYLENNKNKRR